MPIIGIYKITSPSNKVYIGCSNNIYKRWSRYKNPHSIKTQYHIYNSLIKYGYENHIFEIIETLDNKTDLIDREIYWINYYESTNPKIGLNISKGGNIPPIQNKPKSPEHKAKISAGNLGKRHTEETKNKIREKRKLQIFTPEQIKKAADARRGVPSKLRGRKRENISKKLKGRFSPISIKCKLINTITGQEIEANSIQELSRLSKISVTSILNIRKGLLVKKYDYFKYEQSTKK